MITRIRNKTRNREMRDANANKKLAFDIRCTISVLFVRFSLEYLWLVGGNFSLGA